MTKKKRGPGYIYLIHAEGTPFYKIGHATNVRRRLYQIDHHNIHRCSLIHSMPVESQLEAEAWWHGIFYEAQIKGEWFELSEKQVKLFCSCEGGSLIQMQKEIYIKRSGLFRAVMQER